ncbi:uncharacterized radical SAM protein YgiQ [Acetitomaculum ruminis DSM 5522]|uniref:Uncharacterized radical SAM protein YgiQ n=1 Tax=Acetitomaculum ruminis DSM 5522 TaxID=1120918 RepID=A0A1I0V9L3_9FIRM|nr:YgiQ family radical SAM protein [Acetitomaculum ruminis]SFA72932.1 uncharacterized radical SAM protein YgiQ [Acetitomaculum ruminis DSM 5522]
MSKDFLPISKSDLEKRNISQIDFVYIIGDAYVDHPSFGHAIIGRLLEAYGYTVGIISQPDWKDKNSISEFGQPRLGFLVSAGNMDSMVNHYSVSKKRRKKDLYSPGGKIGLRPDYATIVYCNLIRQSYKNVPIIIGGIEASLRRLAHYDYWQDKIKRSILMDSGADLLLYGMGEHAVIEVADALNAGIDIKDITFIKGSVYKTKNLENVYQPLILPTFEEVEKNKISYAKSFYIQYQNTDFISGKTLVETYPHGIYVVQNPPALPLSDTEMDDIYALPYKKTYHPIYKKSGGIPAIEEVKFSLVSNRGCFGACSFCALTFHQGRFIQKRGHDSLIAEAKEMINDKDFKGYIHDVGGPTANFYHTACKKQISKGVCTNKQCLFPKPCKNLDTSHEEYTKLIKDLRKLPGVKKVFIRSGIRFDYLLEDKNKSFFNELCKYHVSGQLKVAPEHVSDRVLKLMGKPSNSVYEQFKKEFFKKSKEAGLEQYLIPYLMSSHPGSTLEDAIMLALAVRDMGYMPQQVQDFYPTPSTLSTCMYYTGLDPRTMEKVYIPKSSHEKAMQRALIQYKDPKNYELVKEALIKAGRSDLIGFDKKCLIKPRNISKKIENNKNRKTIKAKGKGNAKTRNKRK